VSEDGIKSSVILTPGLLPGQNSRQRGEAQGGREGLGSLTQGCWKDRSKGVDQVGKLRGKKKTPNDGKTEKTSENCGC